jgi:hypothetical protein
MNELCFALVIYAWGAGYMTFLLRDRLVPHRSLLVCVLLGLVWPFVWLEGKPATPEAARHR